LKNGLPIGSSGKEVALERYTLIKKEFFAGPTHEILVSAIQGLTNWPNGFLNFIDYYAKHNSATHHRGTTSMGVLYFQ